MFFIVQRVHIWENVLSAAHGHTAVLVLPEAKAGVRREGRRHQGSDGDRKARHRMEDQSRRERKAADQSAAKNGIAVPSSTCPLSVKHSIFIFYSVLFFCAPQAPGYGDIRLSLEMIPDTVNLEEPFDIICKITNCRCES